jgi:hypothetical protein
MSFCSECNAVFCTRNTRTGNRAAARVIYRPVQHRNAIVHHQNEVFGVYTPITKIDPCHRTGEMRVLGDDQVLPERYHSEIETTGGVGLDRRYCH